MLQPLDPAHVLVVDDGCAMADLIVEDLRDRGYDAFARYSGREALDVLGSRRVDAIITDLRMPEVDGLTLLRASLRLDPSRPVIVMTGYGAMNTAMDAVGAGAYQYLVKPFTMETLLTALERALQRR